MKNQDMSEQLTSSHLSGESMSYVDAMYEDYLKDPSEVSLQWREFFDNLPSSKGESQEFSHQEIREYFLKQAKLTKASVVTAAKINDMQCAAIAHLINAYRLHGHHHAKLDPLQEAERKHIADLDIKHHGLTEEDLEHVFNIDEPTIANKPITLKELIRRLKAIYCQSIGIEYMHITCPEQVKWLQQRLNL